MKVFLSSNYDDLINHRKAVVNALERLDFHVKRMEVFGAQPEKPKKACLK